MGKVIRFFNYDAALDYYEDRIDSMRQGSVGRGDGVRIIAKPVLILAIIKGIHDGVFKYNVFEYDKLNGIYEALFRKYFFQGLQSNLTPLCYPFYYLRTDKFWHLSWKEHGETEVNSPSKAWISRNVEHAYLDEELWLLLNNNEYAEKLRDYLVHCKIIQTMRNAGMAAEPRWRDNFKSFLTMLLAI